MSLRPTMLCGKTNRKDTGKTRWAAVDSLRRKFAKAKQRLNFKVRYLLVVACFRWAISIIFLWKPRTQCPRARKFVDGYPLYSRSVLQQLVLRSVSLWATLQTIIWSGIVMFYIFNGSACSGKEEYWSTLTWLLSEVLIVTPEKPGPCHLLFHEE